MRPLLHRQEDRSEGVLWPTFLNLLPSQPFRNTLFYLILDDVLLQSVVTAFAIYPELPAIDVRNVVQQFYLVDLHYAEMLA